MGLTSTNSCRNSLMWSVFRSNRTLYTCFIRMAFLRRTRSSVERLTVWMFLNVAWSARILVCICRSVIVLFSRTIFTSVSCSAVKVHVLPPRCGSLSVLQNTNTVSTLYSIDMQSFSTQGKYNSYLFSILKVLMMAATVKGLRFGWTLWPASLLSLIHI